MRFDRRISRRSFLAAAGATSAVLALTACGNQPAGDDGDAVARGEAVIVDQVLPDSAGVAPAPEGLSNELAVRDARASAGRS